VSDHTSPEEKQAKESTQQAILEKLSQLVPTGQKALFEKLIAQSHFYFALTDQLHNKNAKQEQQTVSGQSWDLLQALFGSHSLFSQQLDVPLTVTPELSRLVGLPDIESIKRQTELFSELAKKTEQLQSSQKKVTAHLQELNELALKRFKAKKSESQNANELYSLWIECGEQAFAKVSQDSNYIKSQTELLNSLTGMDSLRKKMAQSALQQSGLASHNEMEGVHRNLHELKREFRRKSRQQAQEIEGLKKEIISLKRKLMTKQSPKK
jgi:hypothetical protein